MRRVGRWRAAVAALALVAMAACTGGDGAVDDPLAPVAAPAPSTVATTAPASTVAPVRTSAPTTTVAVPAPVAVDGVYRLQPGDRPVEFLKDDAVPEEIQRFIVETLGWAHTDLGDSGPLTVHIYGDDDAFVASYAAELKVSPDDARRYLAGGETLFTAPGGHIWIYLTNYLKKSVVNRRASLFHEYVHTLQFRQAGIAFQSSTPAARSFVPRWMVEGCAKYLEVKVGSRRRLLNEQAVHNTEVDKAKATDVLLEATETAGKASFLGGDSLAYTLGFLACERLALASGEDAVNHAFWQSLANLRDWKAAFAEVFGTTVSAFYADFADWRATL